MITLTQIEYILAVADHQQFSAASKACFVTQPTLSMQIQKAEEELNIQLFDRSTKPLSLTPACVELLEQFRSVRREHEGINEIAKELLNDVSGTLNLAIIPTVSTALLPRFLQNFCKKYDQIKLNILEMETDDLVNGIRSGQIDAAIAATPLSISNIEEEVLYHEPFVAYVPSWHDLHRSDFILQSELHLNEILLLQEGHCFRNSTLNICSNEHQTTSNISIESGNFETLIKLSEQGFGMTLLPYTYAIGLSKSQRKSVKPIAEPKPHRQISLLTRTSQHKKRILSLLAEEIKKSVPKELILEDGDQTISPTRL